MGALVRQGRPVRLPCAGADGSQQTSCPARAVRAGLGVRAALSAAPGRGRSAGPAEQGSPETP